MASRRDRLIPASDTKAARNGAASASMAITGLLKVPPRAVALAAVGDSISGGELLLAATGSGVCIAPIGTALYKARRLPNPFRPKSQEMRSVGPHYLLESEELKGDTTDFRRSKTSEKRLQQSSASEDSGKPPPPHPTRARPPAPFASQRAILGGGTAASPRARLSLSQKTRRPQARAPALLESNLRGP